MSMLSNVVSPWYREKDVVEASYALDFLFELLLHVTVLESIFLKFIGGSYFDSGRFVMESAP